MSGPDKRLSQLHEIAAMVSDARTAVLRVENQKREDIRRQLAALDRRTTAGATTPEGILPLQEIASFGYEQWVTARRAALNARLAAQTVSCFQAADDARLAFGRKLALEGVMKKKR